MTVKLIRLDEIPGRVQKGESRYKTWNPIRARRKQVSGTGDQKAGGYLDMKVVNEMLGWRKPQRVFVCSMTDLFHGMVEEKWIDQLLGAMARRLDHAFMILTKRPERMLEYLAAHREPRRAEVILYRAGAWGGSPKDFDWPLPNVTLGVSVANQQDWNHNAPLLRECPAAFRFVSLEPQIEHVAMGDISWLDLLIIGGESGPQARSAIAQCRAAGVACYLRSIRPKEAK